MAAVVLGAFALTILHGRHHGAAQSATVSAQSASAKTTCWKQIQDDWVDDGVIEGVYPLHCYGEAIKHVPNDLAAVHGNRREDHCRPAARVEAPVPDR